MRYHIILRYAAFSLLLNSFFMMISSLLSVVYSDGAFMPLFYSAVVTALFGIFPLIFIPSTRTITNKEGISIVVGSWLLSCIFGALPYILFGGVFNFTNAWFESVSGFTTTGASILTNIEDIPQSLLFWRASTHWLGGIGIIIFVLSLLPFLGIEKLVLFRIEISSMAKENFRYRARKAIQIIAFVYVILTFAETVLLYIFGMNLFDAVTHSFATIATGGFSSKNTSIAFYNSPSIEIVIIIFMILSGINFALLFTVSKGNIREFFKSTVVKYYLSALLIGIVITSINIHSNNSINWSDSFRIAAFNIISIGTSTGFANADTSVWPYLAKLLLIFFALQCACAGSTSGGIKVDRIVILGKIFIAQLKKTMNPNAVISVKMDNSVIKDDHTISILLYICMYLVIVLISTMLLSAMGVDLTSAFSGVVANMGNVGPGLGTVGSAGNYFHIPFLGKWILSIVMLLGRLEIYILFIFFTRVQWSKKISYMK
ncbi:TrkH family potassium uptake protein [candidate division KSB1 bacterium]